MTNREIGFLLLTCRLGDPDRKVLSPAQLRTLTQRALTMEQPLQDRELTKEDLVSIGTIGLIKAINTFRADRNIKLATYASRCIENEILMFLLLFCKQITVVILESCSLPLVKKTLAGSVCSRGGSPHPHFLTPCANAMCLPRFAAQAAFATNTAQRMRGKRWDSYKLNGIFQSKCA